MNLQGKGFFIWQISRCENGNADAIARAAVQAGLSHVLVKIADGTQAYNLDALSGFDRVGPVVQALRSAGIMALGWHYVYGYDPLGEAEIALQRLGELDLDAYVINAEAQYKEPGKEESARRFIDHLRSALPDFPMALSSYRYPSWHPAFPFEAFLEGVDINMPQLYWVRAHNPGEQLARCLREYAALQPFRPIIPTGSAYRQGNWTPSSPEIEEFLGAALHFNLNAANFWEWGYTRLHLPELWQSVAAYDWSPPAQDGFVERFVAALNTHNPMLVLELYNPDAALATGARILPGQTAIRTWYRRLFREILPQAAFALVGHSARLNSRYFTWVAVSSAGHVTNGNDFLGLVDGKITYHYTQFDVEPQ